MRPNSKQLAHRDPALAALMGAIAIGGADFGNDDAGDDYGDEYGDDEAGDDAMAADDFGGRRRRPARPAAGGQAMAMWREQRAAQRASLLNPNAGSKVKVEVFSFTLSTPIVLTTASALSLTGFPNVPIRPKRVTMNAPAPGFALITDIKVANLSAFIGGGSEDAFNYSALGVGQSLDLPTLSSSTPATVLGNYTGFLPPGYVALSAYTFTVSFKGPAKMVQ